MKAPHGLAFHPLTGQLYVADTGNRRVQVLETSGSFGPTFSDPAFAEPVDIAFVPDGSPLVLDAVAGPIYRLAADGAASHVRALLDDFFGIGDHRVGELAVILPCALPDFL